jgi:osmotically-inducible protein OsmY
MSKYSEQKQRRLCKLAIFGAAVPAFLLASSLATSEVRADDDKKYEDKSESSVPTEAITDGWITTKVKSKLLVDQTVSGFDISVETRDKVVYLSGDVENQSQVNHAVEIARETQGVDSVDATSLRIATAVDQARDAMGLTDRN